MIKIGIIGCGGRITYVAKLIKDVGNDLGEDIKITAVCDIDFEHANEMLDIREINDESIRFYKDADEMLAKEELDGVLVGTRCSLHSKMAVKVLNKNIPLFLEKPVATNIEDLTALKTAGDKSKSETVVSFPLRMTPIAKLAKEIAGSGKLGSIEHVQAYNNVPYGGCYFHNWCRDEKETGGLFLQKATHDFDYINDILGIKPVMVCAMASKQIFKGDMPAGLKCEDCEKKNTCPEGPFVMKYIKFDKADGEMCCFAKDTGNQDSGSVIVRYETGMHVNYSQNFFARKKAELRGARFLGYDGTMEFDWYKDELKVFMHNTERVETYKLNSKNMSHGGGDNMLALNFINVIKGVESSKAPLGAGLISALMCLKAQESSDTDRFLEIKW